ncbi:hypothetical protein ASG60_21160 [Methylobacterium sp. Leaf469]|nr:hypothetical protein ASF52_21530 [Methylobacterium sp. Leaf112]KQT92689.1 hypothetical protein ASG60_21160 [Methylobacterium sp. Leaf469]
MAFMLSWPIAIEPLPHIGALPFPPPQQLIAIAGAEPSITRATVVRSSFFMGLPYSDFIYPYHS